MNKKVEEYTIEFIIEEDFLKLLKLRIRVIFNGK